MHGDRGKTSGGTLSYLLGLLASPEHSFGGQQGEGMPQIEPHLHPKAGVGASPRPVFSEGSLMDNVLHHLQILHVMVNQHTCHAWKS